MSSTPRKRRARPKITGKRFDATSAVKLTHAEIEFGGAMMRRLRAKPDYWHWNDEDVRQVLLQLGYTATPSSMDAFSISSARLKREKRGAPTWSEVLTAATRSGLVRTIGL